MVDEPVVHGRQERKGGSPTASVPSAKLADHCLEGIGLVTELRGYVGQRAPVDEEGTQRLIATVKGLLGAMKNSRRDASSMTQAPIKELFSVP